MIERIRREEREKAQAEMTKLHQQYNKALVEMATLIEQYKKALKKLLILIDTESEQNSIKEEIEKLINR